MNAKDCRTAQADSAHLFSCPSCRAEARLAQAWKGLPRSEQEETAAEPDSRFVRSVVVSVRRDRTRRLKARLALLAAAALLFFFFFGTGHEAARPSNGAEESYAAIVSPSALEGLIPN